MSQTTCEALHVSAQWAIPGLVNLAKTEPESKPALLVTNSLLYEEPVPILFALSMVKSALRILVQSLAATFAKEGVHIGVISVGGAVSPEAKNLNSTAIAARTWDWFSQPRGSQTFEVRILEDE